MVQDWESQGVNGQPGTWVPGSHSEWLVDELGVEGHIEFAGLKRGKGNLHKGNSITW